MAKARAGFFKHPSARGTSIHGESAWAARIRPNAGLSRVQEHSHGQQLPPPARSPLVFLHLQAVTVTLQVERPGRVRWCGWQTLREGVRVASREHAGQDCPYRRMPAEWLRSL